MTALQAPIDAPARPVAGEGTFLGLGTVLRKELTEWTRGRGILAVGLTMIANTVIAVLAPFIERSAGATTNLPMDPTVSILFAGRGPLVAFVIILATMAQLSGERDRGTLAWNLTNPVSRTSVIVAKWLATMVAFTVAGVVIPTVVAIPVAVVAYGTPPALGPVVTFAGLSLLGAAFFAALTLGLGTVLKGTPGIAGVAFLVVVASSAVAAAVPALGELLPTEITVWALNVAGGQPASMLTPISWAVAMVALAVLAKVGFDRQEL